MVILLVTTRVNVPFGGTAGPSSTGEGLLSNFGKLWLVANLKLARRSPISRTSVPDRKQLFKSGSLQFWDSMIYSAPRGASLNSNQESGDP